MKRIFRVCLLILCLAALSVSFAACNGAQQATSESVEGTERLSDDIFSLMFSLNGVLFTLPVPFAELEALGWEILEGWQGAYDWIGDDLEDIMLYPHQVLSRRYLLNGDMRLQTRFFNPTETIISLSESVITDMAAFSSTPVLIFPGNIRIGSTYEEVIVAHGEPVERQTNIHTQDEELLYSTEDVFINIVIDPETKLVVGLLFMLLV